MFKSETIQNKWRLPDLSPENPVVSLLIVGLLFSGLVLSTWSRRNFKRECEKPLQLASAASTIEIAKQQLPIVMAGCEKYQAVQEKTFWQKNFEQQMSELQISPTATVQDKYFVLKQFKENIETAKKHIRNPGI